MLKIKSSDLTRLDDLNQQDAERLLHNYELRLQDLKQQQDNLQLQTAHQNTNKALEDQDGTASTA